MWNEFFEYISNSKNEGIKTIFVHNLGSFDGVFIFTQLAKLLKPLTPGIMLDNSNKYIKISMEFRKGHTINWIDSYRMFPVSLNDLCANFGVEGKSRQ